MRGILQGASLLVTLGDRDPLAGQEADPLGERPRSCGLPQAKALARVCARFGDRRFGVKKINH